MQYLKEEENYSIEILNENFKELDNKIPPPRYMELMTGSVIAMLGLL